MIHGRAEVNDRTHPHDFVLSLCCDLKPRGTSFPAKVVVEKVCEQLLQRRETLKQVGNALKVTRTVKLRHSIRKAF